MAKNLILIFLVLFITKNALASSEEAFRKGDYDAAFRKAYLADVVENDPTSADLFVLGRIYFEGLGTSEKDLTKAIKIINKSISKGNIDASLYLAEEYEKGQFLEKNLVSSLKFYKKAQDLGKKNLEEKIASISSEVSGGSLTEENCREVISAANAQQENFFIMAARCAAELYDDLPTAQEFIGKKFDAANEEDKLLIVNLLSNPKGTLFSPAFALELISSLSSDDATRDEFFSLVFAQVSGKMTTAEFKKSVGILSDAYFNDDTIFQQLANLFEITTASRNPAISNLAVNFISSNLEGKLRQKDLLQITSTVLAAEQLQGEGRRQLVKYISDDASLFFSKNKSNPRELYSYVEQRLSIGICTPIYIAVKNETFYSAVDFTKMLSKNVSCNDGDFEMLIAGFSGFPNISNENSVKALKVICSDGVSNACHALGILYRANRLNTYTDVDSEQLAFVSFETASRLGNADSSVELSLIAADKGQKKKALTLAKAAQQKGLVEGHYAEAYTGLKSLFSSSSKSCIPLNTFISKASVENRFYEDAKLLQKKKKCGN